MSLNWNNIRPIGVSRNDGFEEFVCQLAAKEAIPGQKTFFRIGKPDGGKECFWELEDGSIWCWQAKYFTTALTASQWKQIEKSVKDTIANHNNLVNYFICVPIDMPDVKVEGKSSLKDKWHQKVTDWTAYAKTKGMNVSFTFWGSHEMIKRLQQKEFEGFRYFWFNEQEFTDEWFDRKNQESIDSLGNRYTPDLNFKLPIAKIFDGLSRNESLQETIESNYSDLLESFQALYINTKDEVVTEGFKRLKECFADLITVFEKVVFTGVSPIPTDILQQLLDGISAETQLLRNRFYYLREEEVKTKPVSPYTSQPYSDEISKLQDLSNFAYTFSHSLSSPASRLTNMPCLILTGKAGIGKSHLLADVVESRKEEGALSLLLLGESFVTRESPWTQLLCNQLRLNIDEYMFLGALNAKAECLQKRIIVFIDALNEGEGKVVWPSKLKAFIRSFSSYPWLGLVVSIRSSFLKLIAPETEIDQSFAIRYEHRGFSNVMYEASLHFFHHYKITPPGTPLLHPEFQYPLFLKLFCEGLAKREEKTVPPGYEGITTIIHYFIESVELKLSKPEHLYYDVRLTPVRNAVEKMLSALVESGKEGIPYVEAHKIVDQEFSICANREPYLERLISEGVFNEDMYWNEDDTHYMGIHFAYQRFHDHLLTGMLLKKHLSKTNAVQDFQQEELHKYLKSRSAAEYHRNIIEAMAVQVPEITGMELHEIAPHAEKYYSVMEAFIDSLVWRKPETITERSWQYVHNVVGKQKELYEKFLDTVISMATKPAFLFNGNWLHEVLSKLPMAKRDLLWTTLLQDKYGPEAYPNAVKTLIDWAWSEKEKSYISVASADLAATVLTWCLTSSNRYLRDGSTKALVCLLQDRMEVLLQLLQRFEGVNDPYVYERLFAVAYGCAVRTRQAELLLPLSEYVFKVVFQKENVFPHILLRDYARGIIEYTVHLGLAPSIEIAKVRPPYKSTLPKRLPTINQIDRKYKPKGEEGHYDGRKWGAAAILSSMTTEYGRGTAQYGDFGRYTFQSALQKWKVNYDGLSNYAIQRIFEMGYDPLKFTPFDKEQGSGRGSAYKERIGKKYQWIAFYEILAKVADNCDLYGESYWKKQKTIYDGPWRPYVRDIDPTMVIRETKAVAVSEVKKRKWWLPSAYNAWKSDLEQWMLDKNDLPKPQAFLMVTDEKGEEWVNLQVYPEWSQPRKRGERIYARLYERIWYHIGSLFVSDSDLEKLQQAYLKEKIELAEPDVKDHYQVYSREYFWSPAWKFFHNNSFYSGEESFQVEHPVKRKVIAKGFHTVCSSRWEEEFDQSKNAVIDFLKPSALLAQGLKQGRDEGAFLDENGLCVCFDPSVYKQGPSCLLIKRDYLLNFLKHKQLNLVWMMRGEKQIMGSVRGAKAPTVAHRINGYFYLDESNRVQGEIRSAIKR